MSVRLRKRKAFSLLFKQKRRTHFRPPLFHLQVADFRGDDPHLQDARHRECHHGVLCTKKGEAAGYKRSVIAFHAVTWPQQGRGPRFALMKLNNSMFYN